jgi:diguanylate cyclase (GGDEF)-like protein/PAS domain S-box-containing protein
MTFLRRIPLTPKVILLTTLVAIISWGALEYTHEQRLRSIFERQINRQLDLQAQEARVRFDNYANGYHSAMEVTVSQNRFTDYLESRPRQAPSKISYHDEIPPWMPASSVMRRLVRVSYAMLMDEAGNVNEVYQGIAEPLPSTFLQPDTLLRTLSANQILMTEVDNIPFVLTAKPIFEEEEGAGAILMFASPLDDNFLTDSQGFAGARQGIVVLLSADKVIASNRPDILPGGTPLSEVNRSYHIIGKSFFDIGTSDLLVEFASLISKAEYEALGAEILAAGRKNRLGLTLTFIVIFSVVMSLLTRRIEGLTKRVSDFSEKQLGGLPMGLRRGDQLDILDHRFQRLTEEVVLATERLKRARDELELRVEERTTELSESEKRYRLLLNSLNEGIWALDKDGFTTFVNPQMAKMLGYQIEEMLGKSLFSFMDERGRERAEKGGKFLRKGRAEQSEQEFIGKDGGRIHTIAENSPIIDEQGNYTGAIAGIIDITERKRMEETITHQAHHDLLTGLANRALFIDCLHYALSQTHRYQRQLAVFSLDIDRFKPINDTLGHTVGDELLKEIAARIRPSIREADTLARIGGDEFTILLSHFSKVEDISAMADKIMAVFKKPFIIADHTFYMTISIGISIFPEDGADAESLIKNADIAMYHAKETGRNNYKFYNPSLNIRTIERMLLGNSLRQTLSHGELELFYQPQFNIATGQIVCAEALVRWRHPELGILNPGQFLPLAEEIGLMVPIDEWVLRTACRQNKAWQQAAYPPFCITVNLSAQQFRQPGLVELISRVLQETELDPEWLELEVTENIAMQDIEHTIPNVRKITDLGINFSIDDFGTGYSSLSHLKRLPLHKLKIDKSFIHDITVDHDDQIIVNAVISLAHSMELRVVAEGVETEEQLSLLRSSGCDEIQGFLGSPPLPWGEYEDLLKKNPLLQRQREPWLA